MLEKGFLHHQKEGNTHRKVASTASQVLLILGVLIIAASFVYLLINRGKSDAMVTLVMPFLVAGLGLIFVSYLIRRAFTGRRN